MAASSSTGNLLPSTYGNFPDNFEVEMWHSWTKRKAELRASGELKKMRKWMVENMEEEFSSSGGPDTPSSPPADEPPADEPEPQYSFSETQEAMFSHMAAWYEENGHAAKGPLNMHEIFDLDMIELWWKMEFPNKAYPNIHKRLVGHWGLRLHSGGYQTEEPIIEEAPPLSSRPHLPLFPSYVEQIKMELQNVEMDLSKAFTIPARRGLDVLGVPCAQLGTKLAYAENFVKNSVHMQIKWLLKEI